MLGNTVRTSPRLKPPLSCYPLPLGEGLGVRVGEGLDVGWVEACRHGVASRRVTQQLQPIALGVVPPPNLRNFNTSKTFVSQPGG